MEFEGYERGARVEEGDDAFVVGLCLCKGEAEELGGDEGE